MRRCKRKAPADRRSAVGQIKAGSQTPLRHRVTFLHRQCTGVSRRPVRVRAFGCKGSLGSFDLDIVITLFKLNASVKTIAAVATAKIRAESLVVIFPLGGSAGKIAALVAAHPQVVRMNEGAFDIDDVIVFKAEPLVKGLIPRILHY